MDKFTELNCAKKVAPSGVEYENLHTYMVLPPTKKLQFEVLLYKRY